MATARFLLTMTILGAFLGLVVATLVVPRLLPSTLCGITADDMTSRPCVATVEQATANLVRAQTVGGGIGGAFGLILAGVWAYKSRETAKVAGRAQTGAGGSDKPS